MKLVKINPSKPILTGIVGIALASSLHAATTVHTVAEPSFGPSVAGAGAWSYASTTAWKNSDETSASYFYGSAYVAASPIRPTARTGEVALHGSSGYARQILSDTFVTGRTYTFTAHLAGDANSSGTSDRTWMYLFDGTSLSNGATGSAITWGRFLQDGSADSIQGSGIGTNTGWSRGTDTGNWATGGGTWGNASLSYTAIAADAGKPIGIAFWSADDAAYDDVSVTSIPEPSSAALLGLGGLALLLRRRK